MRDSRTYTKPESEIETSSLSRFGSELGDMLATVAQLFASEVRENSARLAVNFAKAAFSLGICLIGTGMLLVAFESLLAALLMNFMSSVISHAVSATIIGIGAIAAGYALYRKYINKISTEDLTPKRSIEAFESLRRLIKRATHDHTS